MVILLQKYNFYAYRTDTCNDDKKVYKTITFSNIKNENNLKEKISKELDYFFKLSNVTKKDHIFIVGLGNENNTADSIGPKTLKHIKINAYLDNIGYNFIGNKVSALEPGVLEETGIITSAIIESVVDEIRPNLVILIDSFIDNDIKFLNRKIELNNIGLKTGAGIIGLCSDISINTLKVPVIVIGVTTAVELSLKKNNEYYLLTSKNIDSFVLKMSKIIGEAINLSIDNLK